MAFPTALCAPWRCALRRASFGRRGVLLGAQLALSQRQRQWAEKAMEGEPLPAEHWVDLAEAALEKAAQLPCQDVLALLGALDRQAEDLSVTLVLAARLTVLAPTMALDEILDAWQLLMRQPPAVRKKLTVMRALEELELSLRQCPLDAMGLTQTLACLAAGGGTLRPELLQRLARQALELRDLGYQEMVAIEAYFEALGGLLGLILETLEEFILPHHTYDIHRAWGSEIRKLVTFDGGHNGVRPKWFLEEGADFLALRLKDSLCTPPLQKSQEETVPGFAMIRPPKKTNVPAVIFGFAVLATIGTASYAVMSRSIDKERMFRGVIFDIERMKQKAQAKRE
eukprot:s83_g20.t2